MLAFLLSICDPKYHPQITYLVETYRKDLLIYAKHIMRNAGRTSYTHDAEDVVQNMYMKVSKYCKRVRFEEDSITIRGYLRKILKNEAMIFLKEYEYIESLDDGDTEPISEENFIEMLNAKEDYEEVIKAIKEMKPIYCFALSYKFCNQMTIEDIANLLGVSQKTIYTRIERGKKLLIDKLEKGGKINVNIYK